MEEYFSITRPIKKRANTTHVYIPKLIVNKMGFKHNDSVKIEYFGGPVKCIVMTIDEEKGC